MAVEARQQLNTEVVDQLNQLFDPLLESPQEQLAFADLVSQIHQGNQQLGMIRARSEEATLPFQERVSETIRIVDEAEATKRAKRAEIYSPKANKNLGVIIGRIKVALADPDLVLPTPLRPLKLFALDIHPDLAPFHQQLEQARNQMLISQGELHAQEERIKGEANQAKYAVEQDLHQASQNLIALCDQRATQSRSLSLDYLGTLPDRVNLVTEKFVSNKALSEVEIQRFPEFISFLRSNKVSEERIKRWLNGLSDNPTIEQLAANSELLRRWKDYLRYNFLEDCFKSGIITRKPDVPISLSSRF